MISITGTNHEGIARRVNTNKCNFTGFLFLDMHEELSIEVIVVFRTKPWGSRYLVGHDQLG